MAPTFALAELVRRTNEEVGKPQNPDGLVLEAWAQGYMVGSLVIMAAIAVANMRKGVILHKLILIELILGMFHGTFIFTHAPVYGWYLSCTAIFLNMSWSLHNVIAWLKNKPFLSKKVSYVYIGTVILAQPYWVVEIYANFTYFNNINNIFTKTRPVEAVFRDPWWIFTTISLFWNIKVRYEMGIIEIVRLSPRFGVLLAAMVVSIGFIIVDIVATAGVFSTHSLPDGINPFWKLAFVFKCLTDTIVLDDFKTALDRLSAAKLQRLDSFSAGSYRTDPLARPSVGRLDSSRANVRHIEREMDSASLENGKALSFQDALRMREDSTIAKYDATKRSIIITNNEWGSGTLRDLPHHTTPRASDADRRASEAKRLADEKEKLQRWWG